MNERRQKAVMVQYMLRQLAVQTLRITVVIGVFFMIVIRIKVYYRVVIVVQMETGFVGTNRLPQRGSRRRLGLRPAVVGGTQVGAEPGQFIVERKKKKDGKNNTLYLDKLGIFYRFEKQQTNKQQVYAGIRCQRDDIKNEC